MKRPRQDHGIRVGCYASLDRLIEDGKQSYREAFKRSSEGWREGIRSGSSAWGGAAVPGGGEQGNNSGNGVMNGGIRLDGGGGPKREEYQDGNNGSE